MHSRGCRLMWVSGAWWSETSIIAFQIHYVIALFSWVKVWCLLLRYLLYAVLFKHIVNWTLVVATFKGFFREKVNINIYLGRILYWNILCSFMPNLWFYKCLLQLLSGDIEFNPGPRPNSCKSLLIFYWNLNSITSHNFINVSLLTAYNSIHKF